MINKHKQRQEVKAKRASLNDEQRKAANHQITQRIIDSEIFKQSQKIACYMAIGAEVNLQEVIEVIFSSGKRCYLPLVRHDRPNYLYFVEYLQGDQLQPGNFGILEPAFDPQKIIEPDDLDLVLLPLVAFDAEGNRLGTGGGYYDRTFAQVSRPLLIGVAYACQEVPQIEACPHDVKLHGVVTEKEFRMF
jgi:5-formyltetrahydrofolate cyclo-ligase